MKTKFSDRAKRFFKALNARVSNEDKLIIEKYLQDKEKKLFYSMSLIDQQHCLNVTKTILNSNKKITTNTIKLALLHDIGKQVKPFYLLERVIVVLFPRKNLKLPFEPLENSLLKKAWQLKYWHPEYGAILAKKENFDDFLIELIRYHHHLPPRYEDIAIFQWADNLN